MNKINLILASLFSVLSIILSFMTGNYLLLLYILMVIVPFIIKLNPMMTLIYLLFSFIAMFLGNMLHLFRLISWYDSFSHFLWGIVSSLLGIYILFKFKMFNTKNILFNLLFLLVFSLATSGLWEMMEFCYDNIFGGDMQRVATGVYDTMKDIIVCFCGNVLFLLWFFFEYHNKKSLLIHSFVKKMNEN